MIQIPGNDIFTALATWLRELMLSIGLAPIAVEIVMAFVRARADAATDQDTRDLYAALERGIATRDMPDKGPLADPELWTIESRLDSGALDGILSAVEAAEQAEKSKKKGKRRGRR